MTQPPDDAALVARLRANADPRCHQHVPSLSLEAATALEAKDRRITAFEKAAREVLKWIEPIAGDNTDKIAAAQKEASVAALRAALEPSDKGVGSRC